MDPTLKTTVMEAVAFTFGLGLGGAYGFVAEWVRRRREKTRSARPLHGLGSGALTRTAGLLVVLVVIQVVCPVFFRAGLQWPVLGGIVAGYGSMLFRGYLRLKRNLGP